METDNWIIKIENGVPKAYEKVIVDGQELLVPASSDKDAVRKARKRLEEKMEGGWYGK